MQINPVLLVLAALVPLAVAASEPSARLEQQARELSQRFTAELKPKLQAALREGGPAHAIAVCSTEAPRVASSLSTQSGWNVRRVSLNPRNLKLAKPDNWERGVLTQFDLRQASGESANSLHYGEIVDGQYRYMQAQAVAGVCLICHGKSISAEVKQALDRLYPDDTATGYALGQVRGAISLSRGL